MVPHGEPARRDAGRVRGRLRAHLSLRHAARRQRPPPARHSAVRGRALPARADLQHAGRQPGPPPARRRRHAAARLPLRVAHRPPPRHRQHDRMGDHGDGPALPRLAEVRIGDARRGGLRRRALCRRPPARTPARHGRVRRCVRRLRAARRARPGLRLHLRRAVERDRRLRSEVVRVAAHRLRLDRALGGARRRAGAPASARRRDEHRRRGAGRRARHRSDRGDVAGLDRLRGAVQRRLLRHRRRSRDTRLPPRRRAIHQPGARDRRTRPVHALRRRVLVAARRLGVLHHRRPAAARRRVRHRAHAPRPDPEHGRASRTTAARAGATGVPA